MKFKYLGEPGCEAPEVSTHFDVEFHRGQFVDVTDELAIAKLARHPHFVAQDETSAPKGASALDAGESAKPVKRRKRAKKSVSGGINADDSTANRKGDEAHRGT